MESNIEVIITDSPKKLAKRAGKEIVRQLQESGSGRFDIALSGGSTPGLLFDRLAMKYSGLSDWRRVHLWWGDERCLPPGSEESNFRMSFEKLISKIPIPPENIHRIKGEENPDLEAKRYGEEIAKDLYQRNGWPVFDLILLGMGDDGHVASIFPDQMELMESSEFCSVAVHPDSGQRRITLTGYVINNANQIFMLVTGSGKSQRVAEIMNNEKPAGKLPAFHIIPVHGSLTWFLDSAAAGSI